MSKKIPGILLFIDFEKAFDTIEWLFIQNVLRHFNFGQVIRKWVSILYSDVEIPLHQEPGKKSGKPGQVWFNQTYQAFVKKTSLVKSLVRLVLPGF